jgi:cytochrome c oxidase cbb3-type subunit III
MRVALALPLVSVLAGAILLSGCKREERGFRVDPPNAARIDAKMLSTLQPGGPNPHPPVKNEYEENAHAMSEGKRLYTWFNCNGCHAHGGGDIGPPLMDSKWIYGHQPEQIFATIVEGRPNGMPAFRQHIPDYQVWQLVAYVRSMSGIVPSHAAPGREDDMKNKQPEHSTERADPKASSLPKSAEMPQ